MAREAHDTEPLLAGIEIGGTKLQVALGTRDGKLTHLAKVASVPSEGAEGVLRRVVETLGVLKAESGQLAVKLDALGVGFGGPVVDDTGHVVTSHQVTGWDDFDLAAWSRQVLGCERVRIANDADTSALAEALLGSGRNHSTVLYVNSGSGVGGGLVVNQQIYRGGSGLGALEFGHLMLDLPGHDRQGHPIVETGTIESFASGWAIEHRARQRLEYLAAERPGNSGSTLLKKTAGRPEPLTVAMIGEAALEGDQFAIDILNQAAQAMGRGLASAVTLLAPSRVVLGGGVSLLPPSLWLDPISRELDSRVFPPFRGRFEVVSAQLREDTVVKGALLLAVEALQASQEHEA